MNPRISVAPLESFRRQPFEICIWKASVERFYSSLDFLRGLLSCEEQKRFQRLIRMEDKNRFIISRGILRFILGRYLAVFPEDVKISYLETGKPVIDVSQNHCFLEFSLSHSGHWVVYAFSRKEPVGIDIEQVRDVDHLDNVAESVLTDLEYENFLRLPAKLKSSGFLQYWTSKEACYKAEGGSLAFKDIEIYFSSDGNLPEYAIIEGGQGRMTRRFLTPYVPDSEYLGVLSCGKRIEELRCFEFDETLLWE